MNVGVASFHGGLDALHQPQTKDRFLLSKRRPAMCTLEIELSSAEFAWRYIVSGISTMPETEGQLLYIAKGKAIRFTTDIDQARCLPSATARIKRNICSHVLRDITFIPVPNDDDLFLELALPENKVKGRLYQQIQWRLAELRAELATPDEERLCEDTRRNYEGQVEGLLYALGYDHIQAMRQVYA
jgi:hypothetical protein